MLPARVNSDKRGVPVDADGGPRQPALAVRAPTHPTGRIVPRDSDFALPYEDLTLRRR